MPSRELLGLLWQEVALAREDANPRLSLQGLECRRFQGGLHLVTPGLAPREEVLPIRVGETLCLPDGLGAFRLLSSDGGEGLRPPREDEPLSVRFQVASGVMLKPVGRVGSRRLKKLLQEYGVPSWQRGRIPILYYGEQVALVAGLFVCDGFLAPEGGIKGDWRRAVAPALD